MNYEIGTRDPDRDKGFLTGKQREFLQTGGGGFDNRRQYRARIRNNLRNTVIDLLYLDAIEEEDLIRTFAPLAESEGMGLNEKVMARAMARGLDLSDIDLTQMGPDTDPRDLATGWDMYMGLTNLLIAVIRTLGPEIVKDLFETSIELYIQREFGDVVQVDTSLDSALLQTTDKDGMPNSMKELDLYVMGNDRHLAPLTTHQSRRLHAIEPFQYPPTF